jgi:hypothetical protein
VVAISFVRHGGDTAGGREPRLPLPDPGHLLDGDEGIISSATVTAMTTDHG